MPPDPDILGFANLLYPSALKHPLVTVLDGVTIQHIDAPHFLGTKLLAYEDRGKGEIRVSHDLEDLLAVLSSRPETGREISGAPEPCRQIVQSRLRLLRDHPLFHEALEGHLANDVPGQAEIVRAQIDAVLAAG